MVCSLRFVPVAVALAAAVIASVTPAQAGKPKKDLTSDGYTCVRVAVNFIECTKSGAPTYWCDDAGNCEQKARVKPKDAVGIDKKGVLEVNPGSSGGGTKSPAGKATGGSMKKY